MCICIVRWLYQVAEKGRISHFPFDVAFQNSKYSRAKQFFKNRFVYLQWKMYVLCNSRFPIQCMSTQMNGNEHHLNIHPSVASNSLVKLIVGVCFVVYLLNLAQWCKTLSKLFARKSLRLHSISTLMQRRRHLSVCVRFNYILLWMQMEEPLSGKIVFLVFVHNGCLAHWSLLQHSYL